MTTDTVISEKTSPREAAPRAKGLPLLGNTLSALMNPLGFLVALKNEYADLVQVRVGNKNYLIIQSPEGCRHVLQENARNYFKPGAAKLMKRFLGEGLATSNGDLWLRQRRLIQPAFHRKKIESLSQIINAETSALIRSWQQLPAGRPVNVSQEFLKLTLRNINKAMFGTDVDHRSDEIATVVNRLLAYASSSVTSIIKFPLWLPTPSNIRFLKANQAFEKIIYGIIRQRQQEDREPASDLLDLLLHASDDKTGSMTSRQLRDEISTIFMAGHETTAQTLSWVFYQLATNPEECDKVRIEAAALGTNEISIESLQHLSYTRAVIEETMRLYPPVWLIARKSVQADAIHETAVAAGATVLINIYGMNHHAGYWNSPEMFQPGRFLGSEGRHPFLFVPFGGGQRLCIGSLFAMMVMQTVVARLVLQFSFKVQPGAKPIKQPSITLRAKGGIHLIIEPVSFTSKV